MKYLAECLTLIIGSVIANYSELFILLCFLTFLEIFASPPPPPFFFFFAFFPLNPSILGYFVFFLILLYFLNFFLYYCILKDQKFGTSLVVQCLSLHAPNAGGPEFNPQSGNQTRSCMLQLRPSEAK